MRVDARPRLLPARDWGERWVTSALLTLLVTGLWGEAGNLVPAPLDGWHNIPYRVFGQWWETVAPQALSAAERSALFQLIAALVFAMAIPLLALRSRGVDGRCLGLGLPMRFGVRTTVLGTVLALPLGFWLALATADSPGSPVLDFIRYLTMVPEHFLLFGLFGAVLLPARPWSGDQQLGWVFAVFVAALNFGLLHVGTPNDLELLLSVPLGLLFAVMTFVSGSIWPAVVAHAALNLVPLAMLRFFG